MCRERYVPLMAALAIAGVTPHGRLYSCGSRIIYGPGPLAASVLPRIVQSVQQSTAHKAYCFELIRPCGRPPGRGLLHCGLRNPQVRAAPELSTVHSTVRRCRAVGPGGIPVGRTAMSRTTQIDQIKQEVETNLALSNPEFSQERQANVKSAVWEKFSVVAREDVPWMI